ncbi:MAG: hypothetical protein CSA76_06415 [Spirochaetales bacterium]|nr:MAG: hypothetical protein CSA76_06415 [Spirochaetales bacterium]
MFVLIVRIIAALSAYGKPGQIALAMAFGVTLAVIPGGTLLWWILLIILMLVRINQAALLVTMGLGRLILPAFADPLSEQLGYYLLTRPFMTAPMTSILSVPGLMWLRLNDSFVFGALVTGLLSIPFCFLIFRVIVGLWRRYAAAPFRSFISRIGARVPLAKRIAQGVRAVSRGRASL